MQTNALQESREPLAPAKAEAKSDGTRTAKKRKVEPVSAIEGEQNAKPMQK
jgi:hypothetical protein